MGQRPFMWARLASMFFLEHSMLNSIACPAFAGLEFRPPWMSTTAYDAARSCQPSAAACVDEATTSVEWSEEDIVFLHWRLLQEVSHLADPEKPLEEKFDTLRWVF